MLSVLISFLGISGFQFFFLSFFVRICNNSNEEVHPNKEDEEDMQHPKELDQIDHEVGFDNNFLIIIRIIIGHSLHPQRDINRLQIPY